MNIITREIGIDMGHRVTNHASKCKNPHGHRYTIQLSVTGDLIDQGSEEGMVKDFGFLKDVMMEQIDARCDHGFALWNQDPLVDNDDFMKSGKIIIVDFVPTAENLAKWWGQLCAAQMPEGVEVVQVKVWETPNCSATWLNPEVSHA